MSAKEDLFNYVIESPENTNPAILKSLLEGIRDTRFDDYLAGTLSGAVEIGASAIINKGAFKDFTSITSIKAPNLINIAESPFYGCTGITSIELGSSSISGITSYVKNTLFNNCSNLDTLILRYSSVVEFSMGDFSGTKIGTSSSQGTIYVPANLLTAYLNSSAWQPLYQWYNNQILAIPEQ